MRTDHDQTFKTLITEFFVWRERVPDTYEIALGGETYVRFHYHLVKLKDLSAPAYLRSRNPLAFALGAKMNYSRAAVVRLKADFLRAIVLCQENPARKELRFGFVSGIGSAVGSGRGPAVPPRAGSLPRWVRAPVGHGRFGAVPAASAERCNGPMEEGRSARSGWQ